MAIEVASRAVTTLSTAPPILASECAVPEAAVEDQAFCPEVRALRRWQDPCSRATLYVGPTGELVQSRDMLSGRPINSMGWTLCVDVSTSAVDQPIQVTLLQGRNRRTLAVWPGVPRSIAQGDVPGLVQGSVARVVVEGASRGRALRSLALRDGLLTEDETHLGLVQSAREVRHDEQVAREHRAQAAALRAVAEAIEADNVFRARRQQFVHSAALGPNGVALTHLDALRARLMEVVTTWSASSHLDARSFAVRKALSGLPAQTRELPLAELRTALVAAGTLAAAFPASLNQATDTIGPTRESEEQGARAADALRTRLTRICELAQAPTRLSTNDVLVDPTGDVIEYDFEEGYQHLNVVSAADDALSFSERYLTDRRNVYVRVRRVDSLHSIRVELDDHGLSQSSTEIAGTANTRPTQGATAEHTAQTAANAEREARVFDAADRHVQLPGTRMFQLGHLRGGHEFTLAVCDLASGTNATCTSATTAGLRLISQRSIPVHGRTPFSLRVGVGLGVTNVDLPVPVLASGGAGGSGAWVVSRQSTRTTLALPVLFTWNVFPWGGRDVLARVPGLSLGIGIGIDALHPLERIIPGSIALEVYGVGLTAGLTLESVTMSRATVGEGFSAAGVAPPDLNARFGTRSVWAPGLLLAVTVDGDLFERLFRSFFGSNLPKIGGN